MTKVSDFVLRFVADHGVQHCFTLSGGGCMHLIDSLGREKRISYVCTLHEQAAAIAAESYAQYKNDLGFCIVTTGPGGTNTITGVAGAWLESTPVLFISGQVKTADLKGELGVRQLGPQEIDMISIVKPITKLAERVTEPRKIRYQLEKAIHTALSGRRGPVWLEIPLDVQAASVDESDLEPYVPEKAAPEMSDADLGSKVCEIYSILSQCDRPIIYAGNGIRASGAMSEFRELVDYLKIPLLLSWKAIDFVDDSNPLYVGRPGGVGQRAANFAQQNCDCLLVIGTRLDLSQVAFNPQNIARGAKRVMVDIDTAEIAKLRGAIHLPVSCDARRFIREMQRQAPSSIGKWANWLVRTQDWKKRYPVVTRDRWAATEHVSTYALIDVLSDCLSSGAVIVPGSSGPCSEVFFQAFRAKFGQRVVNTQGLGSMGFGLPASIGACIASGGKQTICVNGDGGFQLNIQELETVRRLDLPIHYFILANGGYSSIMNTQKSFFNGRFYASEPSSGVTLPDVKKLGAVYDMPVFELNSHADIVEKVKDFLAVKGPAIAEVKVSRDEYTAPRAKSIMRPDGTMVTLPMEDLWPFLPRSEFLGNMLVEPLQESIELKME